MNFNNWNENIIKSYDEKSIYNTILFPLNFQSHEDDIIKRCQFLVNQYHNVIHTFDGHGRLIYHLLKLNSKLTIYLYDIDNYVNQWHKLFLPSNVKVIEGNIFYQINRPISGLVYLNFCSLLNKENARNSLLFSREVSLYLISFFINHRNFATRNYKDEIFYLLNKCNLDISKNNKICSSNLFNLEYENTINELIISKICKRADFITLSFHNKYYFKYLKYKIKYFNLKNLKNKSSTK